MIENNIYKTPHAAKYFTKNIYPTYKQAYKSLLLKPKTDNWRSIYNYVKVLSDIRKSLCGGCGHGTLYDKNNVAYKISRSNTLDEVKTIVEEIRKINQSDV